MRQWVQVGDDIYITIHRIQGDKVRIGIFAPQGVKILRTELIQRSCHAREGSTGGQLVLTRRENEAIRIGAHITITVVKVSRRRVRLGFEAPKKVAIRRVESPAILV
ncbi:carbon storage regulator [Candidatus Peregrinibacteria bacterium]|nr:carbon storage regulator [Candidatus Peregrinibacteria bacterium]